MNQFIYQPTNHPSLFIDFTKLIFILSIQASLTFFKKWKKPRAISGLKSNISAVSNLYSVYTAFFAKYFF